MAVIPPREPPTPAQWRVLLTRLKVVTDRVDFRVDIGKIKWTIAYVRLTEIVESLEQGR